MTRKIVPRNLWDYGFLWITQVMQSMSIKAGRLRGTCSFKYVMGETLDISEYLDLGFSDHVYYKDNDGLGMMSIGRWLGVSQRVCKLMSYWILNHK